jgi:hypothetical protein
MARHRRALPEVQGDVVGGKRVSCPACDGAGRVRVPPSNHPPRHDVVMAFTPGPDVQDTSGCSPSNCAMKAFRGLSTPNRS